MYSDKRSAAEGTRCRDAALLYAKGEFTAFNSSCGLAKMVWFNTAFPEKAKRLSRWIHAADFITGKLTNCWGITDHSNALKSGYSIKDECWPNYLETILGVRKDWLPEVVASGSPIAKLDAQLAKQFGLHEAVQVVAGITDGCASQIASGAARLGDWNTTIGTTLVIKGVTSKPIHDPEGRLYNHRHPDGLSMPGGASNIGADWISKEFKSDVDVLNEEARTLLPTGIIAYPLRQRGERFPFIAPTAEGFAPSGLSRAELFTANLESVAFVERYAYEMVKALSGENVSAVYTAGGGSNSDVWLTIRCNVMNIPIFKMKHGSGAVGAAILAASQTCFSSLSQAAKAMTQSEKEVHPEKALVEAYAEQYKVFLSVMKEKGYIGKPEYA
jgi:sugar (pentulose or hexulose) kinase